MYQVPLKFIKVSKELAICATRIVAIMSTDSYQARETIKAEKKAGTLINGAGRDAALSAVFLDNGSIISSPFTVTRILKEIEKETLKPLSKKSVREGRDKYVCGVDLSALEPEDLDGQYTQNDEQEGEDENDGT